MDYCELTFGQILIIVIKMGLTTIINFSIKHFYQLLLNFTKYALKIWLSMVKETRLIFHLLSSCFT